MFRLGMNVVCVDARRSGGLLRSGAIYRVGRVSDRFLAVDEVSGPFSGFYKFRFRPAPNIDVLRALLTKADRESAQPVR